MDQALLPRYYGYGFVSPLSIPRFPIHFFPIPRMSN